MNPGRMTQLIAALLFVIVITCFGCSSNRVTYRPAAMDSELKELTGQNGRACLYTSRIRGYGAISDSVLSVSTTQRKQYLLVMIYSCPPLLQSPAALFEGAFAELCGGGRDRVSTPGNNCPIRSIYEFESRDAAFKALDKAEENIRQAQKNTM